MPAKVSKNISQKSVTFCSARLLDDVLTHKCDEYRRSYANILYCWEMLDQRAEVLKFQVARDESHIEIGNGSTLCRSRSAPSSPLPSSSLLSPPLLSPPLLSLSPPLLSLSPLPSSPLLPSSPPPLLTVHVDLRLIAFCCMSTMALFTPRFYLAAVEIFFFLYSCEIKGCGSKAMSVLKAQHSKFS